MKIITYPVHKYLLAIMGTDTAEGRFLIISLAAVIAVAKNIFATYVWSDPTFIIGLMIVIGIDTFTGIWKSRIQRNFNSRMLGRNTAIKLITYFITLGALKQVDKFLHGTAWAATVSQYFVDTACALMIISEVVSVLENLAVINPNSPFAPIVRTLRRFLKSGAVEDLKPKTQAEIDAEDEAAKLKNDKDNATIS